MSVETQVAPRRVLYRILALAFYEPSAALDDVLESEPAVAEIEQAAEQILGKEGTRIARAMVDAFHQTTDDLDLKVEYNRLFVGPGALPCPPYQSVYDNTRPSEDQGTVMGPTAEAVAEAMRLEGLAVVLDHAELPDHVAVVLEFMVYLLSRSEGREDSTAYADRADQFRLAHIVPWLAEFGKRVAKEARQPFFAQAGRLLERFAVTETI